jgi:outer membrane lipopolysaccharide assembly protein LptE/RlpB
MSPFQTRRRFTLLLPALLLVAGCGYNSSQQAAAPPEPADEPRLVGPFEHENVTVFLVCKKEQSDGDFLTLDEGLREGLVKVAEKEQEQVNELRLDNQSDRPLFLQEGDRLQGGKQDRTIIASMVIPPKSGPTTVPTMCIEQGRWTARDGRNAFGATANAALAPKEVRSAAKVSMSQGEVWQQVADQKVKAQAAYSAPNSNSSLNETLDAPPVKKLSDECARALGDKLDAHPDAVGVAIAVNGKIEEVNIYPNHALLRRLYPRLLQSYAVQAALEKDRAKEAAPVTAEAVTRFMKEGEAKASRTDTLDAGNTLRITDAGGQAKCETFYAGQPVHYQVLSKDPAKPVPTAPRDAAPSQVPPPPAPAPQRGP